MSKKYTNKTLDIEINNAVRCGGEFEFMENYKQSYFPDHYLNMNEINFTLDHYNRFLDEVGDRDLSKFSALEVFATIIRQRYNRLIMIDR